MAPRRANFATAFLLRELLSALGAPLATVDSSNARADSFSESMSEDTESQVVLETANGTQSRVMLVRRTNSSQQTVTLVDRDYDVEGFIPTHVMMSLERERGYQTLGRLRGSVVRITKYHFATLKRCLATEQQARETSVCVPNVTNGKAQVYLWVDALAIVEDNELAVKAQPQVYTHPLVVKRLQTLSTAELEKELMINQGLLPIRASDGNRFDDDRPLLEEDCVIPEEQEQELEEQDDWGPFTTIERQPTDSELIEENGSVSMSESQTVCASVSPGKLQKTMAVSGDLSTTSADLLEKSSMSVRSSLDNQQYLFQQEDIRETFVVDSDSESNDTDGEHERDQNMEEAVVSTPMCQTQLSASRKHHSSSRPVTPKTTRKPWTIVDLTGDSPVKASSTTDASNAKVVEKLNRKTPAGDSQHKAGDNVTLPSSSHTPSKNHRSSERQTPSASWATSLLRMVGLRAFSADTSTSRSQSCDEDTGDSSENDKNSTQILEQTEGEDEKEGNREADVTQPEDLLSSQSTVILRYDDDHTFECKGMFSDDLVSSTSAKHTREHNTATEEADLAERLTLSEEKAQVAITPTRKPTSKNDTSPTGFRTPSPSVQAATPGTEERTKPGNCQTLASESNTEDNAQMLTRDSNHCEFSRSSNDVVLPADPSAQLPPLKNPSELVISVGLSSSRTGFSVMRSRGIKRRHQQTNAACVTPSNAFQPESPVPRTQVQKDGKLCSPLQQYCRRDILSTEALHMAESPSFQFEQPPRSFHNPPVIDSHSLDMVSKSLCSRVRCLTTQEDQARALRQPRRGWRRFENLFPPLNMTHLKHRMAEKDKRKKMRSH